MLRTVTSCRSAERFFISPAVMIQSIRYRCKVFTLVMKKFQKLLLWFFCANSAAAILRDALINSFERYLHPYASFVNTRIQNRPLRRFLQPDQGVPLLLSVIVEVKTVSRCTKEISLWFAHLFLNLVTVHFHHSKCRKKICAVYFSTPNRYSKLGKKPLAVLKI